MDKVYLRTAQWSDIDLLFNWANDNEVRKNSFKTARINYEDHKKWFEKCMLSKDVDIYIFNLEVNPVGQIRLSYNNETAIISYSIAKKYRGQGFGRVLLNLIESELITARPDIKLLAGSVKLNNLHSQRVFEENGYEKEECVDGNINFYTYTKKIII